MTQNPLSILVVDDNRSAADAIARVLRKQHEHVEVAYDGATAIQILTDRPPDLILTDLKMEPIDGMEVLRAARAQRPPIEVIVFTAYGAVDVAVEAMRLGARDFLTKPVTVDQVSGRIATLRGERTGTISESAQSFVAESELAKTMLGTLQLAVGVQSPVWIEGEPGTGRGHAAQVLHQLDRPGDPFVYRELGRNEAWPTSGTVLLSQVDHLPIDVQQQLHRSLAQVPDGVRLIATASADAQTLISEGKLRSDLYYGLAVIIVRVPPLRERVEDIVPLMQGALEQFAKRYDRPVPTLSKTQVHKLQKHAWPGNIRELINLAERAVVMGDSAFDIDCVQASPATMPTFGQGFVLSAHMDSLERSLLVEALRQASGDRNTVCKLLGIERNTLRYKLNKYGLLER